MTEQRVLVLVMLLSCVACGDVRGSVTPADDADEAPASRERDIAPVKTLDPAVLARLAGSFVAKQTMADGSEVYFSVPKPYGAWLCRIDELQLSRWIVSGRPKPEDEFFEDDLIVTRRYAAWRSPRQKTLKDDRQACKEFKNFDKLFEVDENGDPSRYVYLLDRLLTDLGNKRINYKLTCSDWRHAKSEKPTACDPKLLLKNVSIYSRFGGSTGAGTEVDGGIIHRDTLYFFRGEKHGHPVLLSIRFESLQTYGKQASSEADIVSAAIRMEVM